MKSQYPTYDFICFSTLAFEFQPSDYKDVEIKIKRKLILYNLGSYDQKRVDYIRNFKNDLYQEISKSKASKYFAAADMASDYDEYSDFQFDKMINDFRKKYSKINPGDLYNMVNYAIYLYNLK